MKQKSTAAMCKITKHTRRTHAPSHITMIVIKTDIENQTNATLTLITRQYVITNSFEVTVLSRGA